MLRQQAVVVGDVDEIIQLIDKQKVSYSKSIRSTFFHSPVILSYKNDRRRRRYACEAD